ARGGSGSARPATDITMLEIVEAVEQAKIEGIAPPPESDPKKIKEDFPNYKPENSLPLFHKLENLCRQTADIVRKHLEKVRVSELLKKKPPRGTPRNSPAPPATPCTRWPTWPSRRATVRSPRTRSPRNAASPSASCSRSSSRWFPLAS